MTDNEIAPLAVGTDLKSLMILNKIENSEPVSHNHMIDASYKLGDASSQNVKLELAVVLGATTSHCEEFKEIDRIIKNQLYSRDMAGYTTSLFMHDAVSLMDIIKPITWNSNATLTVHELELYHEYQKHSKLRKLVTHVQDRQYANTALENLFHLRKTSS